MQGLAQEVMARDLGRVNADATVGELAWVWGKDYDALGRFWRHRLWIVDGKLAAWGWAYLPYRFERSDGKLFEAKAAKLIWQVHPDRPEMLNGLLDWYDEVAPGVDRGMIVQAADIKADAIVAAHGYEIDAAASADDGWWGQLNVRDLADVPDPMLPDEFRFVAATDVSPADAVKAHRDAWQSTGFTETAFERVRRTWPYRSDLHVFVQAPDGTLAATAIVWLDEATRTAEFEPVGTHKDFRRRGLGTALQLHGMHRAKAAGAARMLVPCIAAPAHPAALNMYYGVGFRPVGRDMPKLKRAR